MKTSSDPRHQRRIDAVKELFAYSFHPQGTNPLVQNIFLHLQQIDALIASAAPEWPLDKVGKLDLAVLRLAVYELTIVKKEPPKVIVDEAVELAKEFGGETSGPFVNGVLGTVLGQIKRPPLTDRPK